MTRVQPGARASYPLFEPLALRWADTDIYGHVNNAVHYLLFDTAVQRFLLREGLLDLGASDNVFLVVHSGCSYFAELTFGQRIEAGLRLARLGRTSITYDISLFADGADLAAATGQFTHVHVGRQSRRPVPLTPQARALFAKLSAAPGSAV